MRRYRSFVLLGLLTLVSAASLSAQKKSVRAGVLAGVTSATFGGDDANDLESKIGLLFGGFLSLGLGERLAIETGAFYSQRGFKDTDGTETAKFKFNYIEIPALLTARFPGKGMLTPFVGVGPAVALKAGCSFSVSGGSTTGSASCSELEDALDIDVRSMDMGLVATIGAEMRRFRATLSYYYGLTTIDGADNPASIKNRVLSVALGYGFTLK